MISLRSIRESKRTFVKRAWSFLDLLECCVVYFELWIIESFTAGCPFVCCRMEVPALIVT